MSVLNQYQLINNQKRVFDPKNKKDVELLKTFLAENKWGGPCPFFLEEPYLNIPDMLKDRYIRSQLNIPQPTIEMLR